MGHVAQQNTEFQKPYFTVYLNYCFYVLTLPVYLILWSIWRFVSCPCCSDLIQWQNLWLARPPRRFQRSSPTSSKICTLFLSCWPRLCGCLCPLLVFPHKDIPGYGSPFAPLIFSRFRHDTHQPDSRLGLPHYYRHWS